MIGGYGVPYDPGPALERLPSARDEAVAELWENLYHQGDVGPASYAAVPALVRHGELSLVAAIEVARRDPRNPKVPGPIASAYEAALEAALGSTPRDEEQMQGFCAIHASVNGHGRLARALVLMSVEETIETYGAQGGRSPEGEP